MIGKRYTYMLPDRSVDRGRRSSSYRLVGGAEWREWMDGGARRVLALVDPVALAAARWKQKAEMDLDRSRWRECRFAAGGGCCTRAGRWVGTGGEVDGLIA